MEAHHATLGRRTLEEIRQKRAAERQQQQHSRRPSSSGSEIDAATGQQRLAGEVDLYVLTSRVRELEDRNVLVERELQNLLHKNEQNVAEREYLVKQLNDLEQNTIPSLRKALHDTSLEKDAAIVAKEDALAQLRTIRKQLKEAEEEQYRAEETAAALRAEVNALQQQVNTASFAGLASAQPNDHTLELEKEVLQLKSQLKQELLLRQQEQQKLADEQQRSSSLMNEKIEIENKLAALNRKASEDSSDLARMAISAHEKEKLESQLHDMALMIERLESGRQKLLLEIDSQSSEIERLFEENSNLSASYQETVTVSMQLENQVKDCLKKNDELRSHIDKLRFDQAKVLQVQESSVMSNVADSNISSNASELVTENLSLKYQLAKEQSRSDGLEAESMKLSAELRRAIQSYNNLIRQYRPVLREIESSLVKMKQDSYATIA